MLEGASPTGGATLWLMYIALALGQDKVPFVCPWGGGGGDRPGGAAHVYQEVKRRTGE